VLGYWAAPGVRCPAYSACKTIYTLDLGRNDIDRWQPACQPPDTTRSALPPCNPRNPCTSATQCGSARRRWKRPERSSSSGWGGGVCATRTGPCRIAHRRRTCPASLSARFRSHCTRRPRTWRGGRRVGRAGCGGGGGGRGRGAFGRTVTSPSAPARLAFFYFSAPPLRPSLSPPPTHPTLSPPLPHRHALSLFPPVSHALCISSERSREIGRCHEEGLGFRV